MQDDPIYKCQYFEINKELHEALHSAYPRVDLDKCYKEIYVYALTHQKWHRHKNNTWLEGVYEWVSRASMARIIPSAIKQVNDAIKRKSAWMRK